MATPLVSIIIPVYNCASILSITIESAIAQTYPNIEIIIVDDGSKDDSYAIAKKYENDSIHVIQQQNAGAAIARNKGLAFATGDFIQFLDAGDVLSNDKIEKQVMALKKNPGKLALCNYIQVTDFAKIEAASPADQSSFIFSSDKPIDFLVNLLGGTGNSNFIQTNCWLIPKMLIEKGGAWRAFRCPDDDGEFFARMILASNGIVHVEQVYNYYLMSPEANQLSTNMKSKYVMNKLLAIQLKHQYLLDSGGHPQIKNAIALQYFYFAIFHFPQSKKFASIAYKRYKLFKTDIPLPKLGGGFVMLLAKIFGWKTARQIRYSLREK